MYFSPVSLLSRTLINTAHGIGQLGHRWIEIEEAHPLITCVFGRVAFAAVLYHQTSSYPWTAVATGVSLMLPMAMSAFSYIEDPDKMGKHLALLIQHGQTLADFEKNPKTLAKVNPRL